MPFAVDHAYADLALALAERIALAEMPTERSDRLRKLRVVYIDLVRTETDIGIRAGKLKDSTLKAKLIGKSTLKFVASPSYIDKFGAPKRPQDIGKHRCILWR